MPKCKCGKELKDQRGAKGHVKFSDDDLHGPIGEIPDDWRDFFNEDLEQQEDVEQEDGEEDEPDRSPSEPTDEKEGTIRRLLTTPIDELF